MALVEKPNGEEVPVEEHELPVTVYAMVSPNGSRADYEIGHQEYGAEDSGYVTEELADHVWVEYTVQVEDYGFEVVDLDSDEVTVL